MQFTDKFIAARKVGTPLVAVRTPDAASTISILRKALGKDISTTPLIAWDAIHGLYGLDGNQDLGKKALSTMLTDAGGIGVEATIDFPVAFGVLEFAKEDIIVFVHNAHLFVAAEPKNIQAVWNLRDGYKAGGNMAVLMMPLGATLPNELNNDVLMLEEPLPTRKDYRQTILDVYKSAELKAPSEEIIRQAGDALIGLAQFPQEQTTAMSLNADTGKLDLEELWTRKRHIVSSVRGLSFYTGKETLNDVGGLANLKKYGGRVMEGKRKPNLILRMDEIEKMFAGAGTDTSGSTGKLLGEFLTWIVDKNVLCILLVGVPGASKSHFIYCLGGEYKVPVMNFNIAAMEDKHVGEGGHNLRTAEATVEAISDGQILLIATANSLTGLPAELLSRFEQGGIFFVDAPNAIERDEILKLKIKKYALPISQTAERPNITGWTGREIESMCRKADNLSITIQEAATYTVPLTQSQAALIKALRQSAHDRYLSATESGLYQYSEEQQETPAVPQRTGRKMR